MKSTKFLLIPGTILLLFVPTSLSSNSSSLENGTCAHPHPQPPHSYWEVGRFLFGTGRNSNNSFFPCWLNVTLVRKGQEFAQKYAARITHAQCLSLTAILCHPQSYRVMATTGDSVNSEVIFRRYLATAFQIILWYTEDILSPIWAQSVKTVKRIHQAVADNFEAKIRHDTNYYHFLLHQRRNFSVDPTFWDAFDMDVQDQDIPAKNSSYPEWQSDFQQFIPEELIGFNQFIASLTQWCFVALPLIHAEELGIYDASEEDFQGFAHLWAVIAHCLGFQENFILCSDVAAGHWGECLSTLKAIERKHMVPGMLSLNHDRKIYMEIYLEGMGKLFVGYSKEALLAVTLNIVAGIRTPNLNKRIQPAQTVLPNMLKRRASDPAMEAVLNQAMFHVLQQSGQAVYGNTGTNATVVATSFYQ